MQAGISVAVIVAVRVRASITRSAEGFGSTTRGLAFSPRHDTRLAHVAHQGREMRASTYRAIIWSARLERTRRLALA